MLMRSTKKTVTLYDLGGMILVWLFFGLPVGIIFDYFWNLLVLSVGLPLILKSRTLSSQEMAISRGRKYLYCLFITVIGFFIDWAYFELTWDVSLGKTQLWVPAMGQPLQLVLLLLPMVLLLMADFALLYAFLKLNRKQSLALGAIMAFFTAPWLLPILPYALGWIAGS